MKGIKEWRRAMGGKRRTRPLWSTANRLWSQRHWSQKWTDRVSVSPMQFVSEQELNNCRFLHLGAHLGNESRTLEFKEGQGNFIRDNLYNVTRIYGCAFMNSGGGCLLVGVRNNGVVCGVNLDHQAEDQARLHVDSAVKTFNPPLLPNNYMLDFLPVIVPGEKRNSLKVLRLIFRSRPASPEPVLFQTGSGEVYLRRDGSVQGPLGASFIQAWFKELWSGKVKQLEQCLHEARCEQWFLAGQVTGISMLCASLLKKYKKACKLKKKLRAYQKRTARANLRQSELRMARPTQRPMRPSRRRSCQTERNLSD